MSRKTFIDIIQEQCERYSSKPLYTFLLDGEAEEISLTYKQLMIKAKMLAQKLDNLTEKTDRILLFYPPGLEYIIAFYACMLKGLIAVPAYPPDSRNIDRIYSIIKDSKAKFALCSENVYQRLSSGIVLSKLQSLDKNFKLLSTDILNEPDTDVNISTSILAQDICFLQYTSGSTSSPKGVMISHENLIANCDLITKYFDYKNDHVMVSWLPPYHDMGLVGSTIQTIYIGGRSIFMSPASFSRKPVRWLQAITKYSNHGQVISGGPNFAYEMCCNYVDDNQIGGLNLSKWRLAYNGAEPVRASTLRKFGQKFSKVGFNYKNFNPVYGLAESTLIVSSSILTNSPKIKKFDIDSLKNKVVKEVAEDNLLQAVELVSCGKSLEQENLVIVNPSTLKKLQYYNIGEIWVKGPSIAKGYWQNKKASEELLNAHIAGTNKGPFLRTGDLGFFDKEENLFITGRIKELIIIRGQNYYPQDIEETAEQACEMLRPACGGAFSIDYENEEVLVLVYELQRKYKNHARIDKIKYIIKEALLKKYGLTVHEIVIIETSSFPKTSSGKLQRQLAKEMYLKKELKEIEQ